MAIGGRKAITLLVSVFTISLHSGNSSPTPYDASADSPPLPWRHPRNSGPPATRAELPGKSEGANDCEDCYCQISIRVPEKMPPFQPLILHPEKTKFLYPDSGALRIDSKDRIRLVCPGEGNAFSSSNTETNPTLQTLYPECLSHGQFKAENILPDEPVTFKGLGCAKEIRAIARYQSDQYCFDGKFSHIQIGFQLPNGEFVTTVDLCFDQDNYDAVYATVKLTPSIRYRQHVTRPAQFAGDEFYGEINVAQIYDRKQQHSTLRSILDSQKAEKYIPLGTPGTKSYLSHGHLVPMGDGIYGAEQLATFFNVNTAPQWQEFNEGNWNDLEISVRYFVVQRTSELVSHTGTWGILQLRDSNNNLRLIYLYVDNARKNKSAVKVPEYFWKVLYDPVTKEGAAFVGINNPFLTISQAREKVFCRSDICDKFKWLQWDNDNVKKGYSFCCTVEEFRKTVTTLPDFTVESVFTPDSKHCKSYQDCNRPLREWPFVRAAGG